MTVTAIQLGSLVPRGGWPAWVFTTPYATFAHPRAARMTLISEGANCQRYAYAVLGLFGRTVPPYRSSELWDDRRLERVNPSEVRDLDLVLFNRTADSWGAHVAVVLASGFLHLSAEVGRPALWQWSDFADRERYRAVIGAIRIAR